MHVDLGGYHVRDVEVVAAFDVDAKKVGTDVAEAIFSEPNRPQRSIAAPMISCPAIRIPTVAATPIRGPAYVIVKMISRPMNPPIIVHHGWCRARS